MEHTARRETSMTDKHTHDKDGACDTLDGCTLGPYEQRGVIEDCGCTHSPCPCEEAECPYYGALCNLCPLHAAAPELLKALEGLKCWDCEYPLTQADYAGCYSCKQARTAIKAARKS